MTSSFPLKRFGSVHSKEAKSYGPGAFAWADSTTPRLIFLYPQENKYGYNVGSIAVNDSLYHEPLWTWDGNLDNPSIDPDIQILYGQSKVLWFGRIRNGVLETIE